MKIAFCLSYYYPYGGMQRDFIRIAQACAALGHEIHVFVREWLGEKPTELNIHLMPNKEIANHRAVTRFAKELLELLPPFKFDKVVGFTKLPGLDIYYAADSCFIAKPQHKRFPFLRLMPRYRMYAALENAVFTAHAKTEILSISWAELVKYQYEYATPTSRVHELAPGVDKKFVQSADSQMIRERIRRALMITEDDFLILSVGSNFRIKGVDRSLAAFASLPKLLQYRCRWLFVGHEKKLTKYQKLAKKFKIERHVEFLGTRHDVHELLFAADLLVHPARIENTGTVIAEAIVSGTPVLVTKHCGYAHYVLEANAGHAIPVPFKQDAMNYLLLTMLNKHDLAQASANAAAYAARNEFHDMISQAVSIITKNN